MAARSARARAHPAISPALSREEPSSEFRPQGRPSAARIEPRRTLPTVGGDFLMKSLLVTGSSGLIGSEVCTYFGRELGYQVHGVDNNQRAVFFGPQGDTRWNQQRLAQQLPGFVHHELDIRDRADVLALIKTVRP